jgi:RHH-type proline utilization regulon transcriptional repressor/proline dehydrogenase/delta 1-pyrroline-5-carboxylate dehydrogenase
MPIDRFRQEARNWARTPESLCVPALLELADLDAATRQAISAEAGRLVEAIRARGETGLIQRFLSEYGLNTDEGVALMCLAEAFLRTPDAATLDELISDKIGGADWGRHLGRARSALVNASTWALMLTGKVFGGAATESDLPTLMRGVVRRLGEPVARVAVGEAMKLMGRQFVLGATIGEALANASAAAAGDLHSFDMLGEAARTARDAARYFAAYAEAIAAIGVTAKPGDPHANSGISIKLSALHPRYETAKRARVLAELLPSAGELLRMARALNVPLAIDAEESDRLELSLDLVDALLARPELAGWNGFGVVVQAYARRTAAVLDWLDAACARHGRTISVRLVKGAYWDSEIRAAQLRGLPDYPVFTRKETTDLSYIACARKLFAGAARIYPQFATHNAHSVAAIRAIAPKGAAYEFQRLHGMGEALHDIARQSDGIRRRVYAPVGVHKDLLAYLVRRLLENGANSSFVHQLLDPAVPPSILAADPLAKVERAKPVSHPAIPLPRDIFGADRRNSQGVDLADPHDLDSMLRAMKPFLAARWGKGAIAIRNPADPGDVVGAVEWSAPAEVAAAVAAAQSACRSWNATPPAERAAILDRAADLLGDNRPELMALAVREAGKTLGDALAETREAEDFLRYYAARARDSLAGRDGLGVVACISPWNFPLAIFLGQVAGALAAGNTIVAKPAEQTPLIASRAAEILAAAGLPDGVLRLVQGAGETGAALTADPRLAGVVFTGSVETARAIELSMARHGNPAGVLIAETGGLNAMIVDSTALPEQAVRDILASAFQSAGQRCSALRMLYVQKDVAPAVLQMLEGAARELSLGDPADPATDIGPAIDSGARDAIDAHCARLDASGRRLFRLDLPAAKGTFVAPAAYRLEGIGELEREIFGPVLHVADFEADELDAVVEAINKKGYGLTFGMHSRIDARIDRVCSRIRAGNIYINRNQIGAVVGVQPFGGEGLSGTGPKAGGPHYLLRLSRARDGAAAESPAGAETVLAGPTGERNVLSLHPRGRIACFGPGKQARERQLRLARSLGNEAFAADDLAQLGNEAGAGKVDAVLLDGPADRRLRTLLAGGAGKRIPLLCEQDGFMLRVERCISEDTTASGGNAGLLAAVG